MGGEYEFFTCFDVKTEKFICNCYFGQCIYYENIKIYLLIQLYIYIYFLYFKPMDISTNKLKLFLLKLVLKKA